MSEDNQSYEGSCVCGKIQMKLIGAPSGNLICYCSDCRKNSGHLGQIMAVYDTNNVEITDTENNLGEYEIKKTNSGLPKHKQFCRNCGCTIRTLLESLQGKSCVRSTLLDVKFSNFMPTEALFEEEKTKFTGGVKCEYY